MLLRGAQKLNLILEQTLVTGVRLADRKTVSILGVHIAIIC